MSGKTGQLLKGVELIMKNSTIIAIVALLVAVAGAAIGLAAFLGKKKRAAQFEDADYEFPFDDECGDCCECCDCCEDDEEIEDQPDENEAEPKEL